MNIEEKKQLTEFLYANAVNKSSNKTTIPNAVDTITKPIRLSNIALDTDLDYNQLTIRVKFSGSKMYFAYGITIDDSELWIKAITDMYISKPKLSFLSNTDDNGVKKPLL